MSIHSSNFHSRIPILSDLHQLKSYKTAIDLDDNNIPDGQNDLIVFLKHFTLLKLKKECDLGHNY